MPNMTPLTPPTTAPADRLALSESRVRAAGVETAVACPGPCCICFADDD
jgi:hypothetical protein